MIVKVKFDIKPDDMEGSPVSKANHGRSVPESKSEKCHVWRDTWGNAPFNGITGDVFYPGPLPSAMQLVPRTSAQLIKALGKRRFLFVTTPRDAIIGDDKL